MSNLDSVIALAAFFGIVNVMLLIIYYKLGKILKQLRPSPIKNK